MSLVELFRRFAHPLNALALPYMATGAVAAIVYGEPRLTLDLDLVLKLVPGEAAGFAAAFPANEFYVPPLEAIRREAERPEHGHFNLLHHESGLRADIYLAGADPLDTWGLAHRRQESLGAEPVWVAPAEYVIVRKPSTSRPSPTLSGGAGSAPNGPRFPSRIKPHLSVVVIGVCTDSHSIGSTG